MSTPFARTTRSLQADRFRPSLILLVIAAGLLVLWIAWFSLSRIPRYVTTTALTISSSGYVTASFPNEAVSSVTPGQPALIELQATDGTTHAFDATIFEVDAADNGNRAITFYPSISLDYYFERDRSLSGYVQLETGTVSPANLIMSSLN